MTTLTRMSEYIINIPVKENNYDFVSVYRIGHFDINSNPIIISVICFTLISFVWIQRCISAMHKHALEREEWNKKEWNNIQMMNTFHPVVNFLNINGFGLGPSLFLYPTFFLIRKFKIEPALKESLKAMEEAEKEGSIDDILCNIEARKDMQIRVLRYTEKLRNASYVYPVSKLILCLKAEESLKNHSNLIRMGMNQDVAKEKIVAPVCIPSLPRTGTTILHRTMALDPRFKSFDLCDMMGLANPVPRWDTDGRKKLAKLGEEKLKDLNTMFPHHLESIETMHGIYSGEADEDIQWNNACNGIGFLEEGIVLFPDTTPDDFWSHKRAKYQLAFLELVLKIHQHVDKVEWMKRNKGKHLPCPTQNLPWLLKNPDNAAYLHELVERFPDIKLIFTHRPMEQILPSLSKLFQIACAAHHIPYSPETTNKLRGKRVFVSYKRYVETIAAFTISQSSDSPWAKPEKKFTDEYPNGICASVTRIDNNFVDLVDDLPKTIRTIYEHFYPDQQGPSAEMMAKFKHYVEKHALDKRLRQERPSLSKMGISKQALEDATDIYNRMFFN